MYKEILRNIDNIEIWPVISFVIFFLFFLFLLLWALTVDKKFIRHMKQMPLNDNNSDQEPSKDLVISKTSVST